MCVSWKYGSNWISFNSKTKIYYKKNALNNIIIKILIENHNSDNWNSKSIVSEEFTMVNSKFRQKKILANETKNLT